MKSYVVTGVPAGVQERAAENGLRRVERQQREGKSETRSTKHRVSGQVVREFTGFGDPKAEAEGYADDLRQKGYIVTMRRR